jgi:hypothetical protein
LTEVIQWNLADIAMGQAWTEATDGHKVQLKHDVENRFRQASSIESMQHILKEPENRHLSLTILHPQGDQLAPVAGISGSDDVCPNVLKRLQQRTFGENREPPTPAVTPHEIQERKEFQHPGKPLQTLLGTLCYNRQLPPFKGEESDDLVKIAVVYSSE